MIVLMVGGAIVAAAGILLMLREGVGGGAAKIAIGPVHLQSSSAGFAIFVAGSVAFAAPLILPESTQTLVERVISARGGLADLGPTIERAASRTGADGMLSTDEEPDNDSVDGAGPVRPDDLAGAIHSGDNVDWFRFDTSALAGARILVTISERTDGCHAHFYDGRQAYLGLVTLVTGHNQFKLDVTDNESFFVRLSCMPNVRDLQYQLRFEAITG
jgi:hypothetical protein